MHAGGGITMLSRFGVAPLCSTTAAALLAMSLGCSSGDRSLDGDPSSSTSQPIYGGTVDNGDPSAVLVGGGGIWCSGTLIAPRVVLTAGHCINPSNNFVYLGPQYLGDAGGVVISVARSYTNPGFQASNFRNADIGIVILASPANAPPVPINTVVLDASNIGQNLQVVGFGGTANPTEPEFTKMDLATPITGVTAKEITAGPSICDGDSGGPGLLVVNGVQVVAGVNSWHSTSSCGGEAGLARVDLYAQWIQQQIDQAEADAGTAADGGGGPPNGADGGPDAHGDDGGAAAGADAGAGAGGDGDAGASGPSGGVDGSTEGGGTSATSSEAGGCTFSAHQPISGGTAAAAAIVAIACRVRRRKRTRRP